MKGMPKTNRIQALSNRSEFSVAVVGATGMVGRKMMRVLAERNFPVKQIIPIASEKSINEKVHFNGASFAVKELSPSVFEQVDMALFSAGKSVSREFAPNAVRSGAVVVDNSSAWRMEPGVPLIVPEVNPHAVKNHNGIIANPNCSTIQMVVVLNPLHQKYKIKRVVVSTYQAVSGSGKQAIQQLEDELTHGKSDHSAYPHPIAYNCLPHIDVFKLNGYSREEMKMILETRKIMEIPDLPITATTVRIPVRTGHSESVNIEFENSFDLNQIRQLLQESEGVVVQDHPQDNLYPMPITAEEKDEVFVGRIRRDESVKNGLNLWIVSDNLRKGAATNAVQIAELLIR